MQRHTRFLRCSRLGLSRVDVVVTICIIGFLFWMIAPAVQSPRTLSRRLGCQNNLKNIALAATSYASANYGRIPLLEDG